MSIRYDYGSTFDPYTDNLDEGRLPQRYDTNYYSQGGPAPQDMPEGSMGAEIGSSTGKTVLVAAAAIGVAGLVAWMMKGRKKGRSRR